MAFEDLTVAQKASLNSWMALFRGTAGEMARVNNHNEVVYTEYNGTVSAILAELANDDIVPNVSGLDGAEAMKKSDIINIVSYMQGFLAYNTTDHRANLAKAAGEHNLIG